MRGRREGYQTVGAAKEKRDRLSGVGDARDFGNLLAFNVHLFDKVCVTQFIRGETVDVSHRTTAKGLHMRRRFIAYTSNEVNLISLNVRDDHDLQFAQEVQRQLIHGIT